MNSFVLRHRQLSRIPITFVGGPAGVGKTTLLRRLLHGNGGSRLAVAFEHVSTITSFENSQATDAKGNCLILRNGNLCLGLDGDVETSLATLHDNPERPDHVVMESSPNDNPIRTFGYAYMPGFRPGASLVVVGAVEVAAAEASTAAKSPLDRQLRHADLVLINDILRIPAASRPIVRRRVSQLATHARTIECERCRVPTPMLLGVAVSSPPAHATHDEWTARYALERSGRTPAHVQPRGDDDYRAWVLKTAKRIRREEFCAWVGTLPQSIVRGDGMLSLQGHVGHPFRFQLCGSRWSLTAEPNGSEDPMSWMSLVGFAPAKATRQRVSQ